MEVKIIERKSFKTCYSATLSYPLFSIHPRLDQYLITIQVYRRVMKLKFLRGERESRHTKRSTNQRQLAKKSYVSQSPWNTDRRSRNSRRRGNSTTSYPSPVVYLAIPACVVGIYIISCTCRICCRWYRHRRQVRERNLHTRNHGNQSNHDNVDVEQTENREERHVNTNLARADHQNVQSSDPSVPPPSYTTLNTPDTHPPSYEELFRSSENTVVQAARLDH